jgi:2-dehydropantoate 2-reductase
MGGADMERKYTFAVVGVGPTGGNMAAHLCDAGHTVFLVDKMKRHIEAIKDHGLAITGFHELKAEFPPENCCCSLGDLSGKHVNVIFIATKAPVMVRIMPQLKEIVEPGTTLIVLQNGMDNEAVLADVFGAENVMRFVINYAGNLISDGIIRHSFFHPPNYIGVIDRSRQSLAEELAQVITEAGMETEFAADIRKRVWQKVILNCGLSALCALTQKTMKEMMDCELTRALVEEILKESIAVAKASNMDFGEGFLDHCIGYLSKAGHHKTSMHVDVDKGNPTEIDFINGKIVEYGADNGVPTPYNSTIVGLIKGLELAHHDSTKNPRKPAVV